MSRGAVFFSVLLMVLGVAALAVGLSGRGLDIAKSINANISGGSMSSPTRTRTNQTTQSTGQTRTNRSTQTGTNRSTQTGTNRSTQTGTNQRTNQ